MPFSYLLQKRLKSCVYSLSYNGKVFYVGKGAGNRVFTHANAAIKNPDSSEKIEYINKILKINGKIQYNVIRHGLNAKEAFEVGSALIDYIGLVDLTNKVRGQHAQARGLMTVPQLVSLYDSKEAKIVDKVILVNINQLYRNDMKRKELYEATRKSWRVNINKARNATFAFSTYRGIIWATYKLNPNKWKKLINDRYMFTGQRANLDIEKKYLYKSVRRFISQYPIRYINVR